MNVSNWIKSILLSVTSGYVVLLLCFFGLQIVDGYIFNVSEQALFIGILSIAYWVISAVGWILLGIPIHFLLCKYTPAKWRYYLYACSVIILLLWVFSSLFFALFWGTPVLFQAMVFRYFVFNTNSRSI